MIFNHNKYQFLPGKNIESKIKNLTFKRARAKLNAFFSVPKFISLISMLSSFES